MTGPATSPRLRPRRVPRWREMSQVRRADLYLRTSLFVLLWGVPLPTILLGILSASEDVPVVELGLVAAPVLVALGVGTVTLREVMALHPRRGPLPWRSLGALGLVLVGSLGVARLVSEPLDGAVVLLVSMVVALATGGLTDRRAAPLMVLALVVGQVVMGSAATTSVIVVAYALFLVFTVRSSLWLYDVVAQLDRARRDQRALAVAEERLRFSRDVHDVMGRRLSAIAVKAELAATLAGRDDERAADQMLEVRGVAHEALREARELARGYRVTDLDTELEGARSLLVSAGIDCEVDVADVPDRWREPAAWVVREAATNVLRHSDATRVTISWDEAGLTVADDGSGSTDTGDGSGLTGLRERLAPYGASLHAGREKEGFVVRMEVGS